MSVITIHNGGFFSCCSFRLNNIIDYINLHLKTPNDVNSSNQFSWYKKDQSKDITYEYFVHYDNITDIPIGSPINYHNEQQYIDYSKLDYENISPVVQKYFSPSQRITDIIKNIEQKYNLVYDNICVLFYRGNDKNTETKVCDYDEYVIYANLIMENNPTILFLIQSDETEFIQFMSEKFPNNSFYFKDEIRHMNKCNNTVDIIMKNTNFIFSKYYLAITILMSKCKYIICGSGNCSIWIMLYRGNNKNVYQNLDGRWLDHSEDDWRFIAYEGDTISSINPYQHVRYGIGNNWIEKHNVEKCFEVTNLYFNCDPAPFIKKQLQMCIKCSERNLKISKEIYDKIQMLIEELEKEKEKETNTNE